MADDINGFNSTSAKHVMPSEALVSSLLKRSGRHHKADKFILDEWEKLQTNQPALSRFISANAYRMAPEDPATRELVTTSMLLMYLINNEAILQDDLMQSLGESWKGFYPLELE